MIGEDFAAVLARAQQGDEAAFARLWRDLNPPLMRYLSLSGDPAEDVAAQAWVSVVAGLRRFRGGETDWRAWVFTTARRRAIDAARRRTREAGLAGRSSWVVEGVEPDACEVVEERLGTEAALRLVGGLPPLQAEVILLRVLAGLPVDRVAVLLGRSPGAVRVAMHRGLRTLQQRLTVTPEQSESCRV